MLSAKNPDRLSAIVSQLKNFLLDQPKTIPRDLACTLQVGREELPERLAFVAGNIPSVIGKLEVFLEGRADRGLYRGHVKTKSNSA